MAYNYQKEKRAWTIWKEAEEKQLRDLGVDEQVIQKLHSYDWMIFNQNRQFIDIRQNLRITATRISVAARADINGCTSDAG
ncbi:MAG: hypothetical protein ACLSBB_18285 [Ruthenibacterium lactatiformans]